jgi:hypothetical protein
VVVGTGRRLFDELTGQVDLTLIEARTFSTGVLAVSLPALKPVDVAIPGHLPSALD